MATGGADFTAELSQAAPCCEICQKDFDEKIHTLRVLSCQHALCGVCVKKIQHDGSLPYPKLRRETTVQGPHILDLKRSVQNQGGVSCQGCSEGARATSRCQECAEFLCEDCSTAHRRVKLSKDHTVVSLSEVAKSAVEFLQTSEKCERHADEKVKLFCVTCSKAVCAICALTMHKKCEELVELDSILSDKKEEMLSLCGQPDQLEQSFQKKAEESEASLEAVDSNLSTAVHQLDQVEQRLQSKAEESEASLEAVDSNLDTAVDQVNEVLPENISTTTEREAESLEAAKSPAKFLQTSEKCDRHRDERLKLFCVTCSKAVCTTCALTMHKKCKEFVELDSILGDKKEEMLSLCGQLDQVQQSLQKKAEESEASLEAVDSNLNTAVHQVNEVLPENISTTTEREADSLEAAKSSAKFLQTGEKCGRHRDERLKLFCVTCSKAVCAICALTMHKKCEELVELDSILDGRKKEMLSLCGQLDQLEQRLQTKAEESEASLEAVDSNLNTAVHQVKDVCTEIASSATERDAEALEDLRATAMSDRFLLKKQAATFRSLQASAHTAADDGRRCVTLSLASQVFSQIPELKETVAELREKAATAVEHAPTYKVATEKLAELKSLLKEIGQIDSTAVSRVVQVLPVTLPSFQLDASRCGSECCVGADLRSLSNQPSSHSHSQPQPQVFRFPGTCGTVAVSGRKSYRQSGRRKYWQVRCLATPKPQLRKDILLFEVGLATQQALQACTGGAIFFTDHCALTARIYTGSDKVKVWVGYRKRPLSDKTLAPSNPHSPVDLTLGLLLDTDASRLHIIDVSATRVLCSSDIDLSTPVWPVVQVGPELATGARVHVEVQTRQQIFLTGDMIRLLQSVLGRYA